MFVSLLAVSLFVLGLRAQKVDQSFSPTTGSLPHIAMLVAVIFSTLLVLGFATITYQKKPSRTGLVLVTACIPWLLLAAEAFFRRGWSILQKGQQVFNEKVLGVLWTYDVVNLLAIVPVVVIICLSLAKPIFTSRGALLYIPFVIIVLARGLASLKRQPVLLICLLGLVVFAHGYSAWNALHTPHSVREYRQLTEKWTPHIQDTDLILIQHRNWALSPIFYYMGVNDYHFVSQDFENEIKNHPESRVWIVSAFDAPKTPEQREALKGFEKAEKIEAINIWAELYIRPSGPQQTNSLVKANPNSIAP